MKKYNGNRRGYFTVFFLLLAAMAPGKLFGVTFDSGKPVTLSLHAVKGFQQEYTIEVSAAEVGKTVYLDLESISRALRLLGKQEGHLLTIASTGDGEKTVCRLVDGSYFAAVVSEKSGKVQRILQLRSAPVRSNGKFWLPAVDAVRLFSLWMNREVVYNEKQGTLEAFLWSAQPESKKKEIGIVNDEDRSISLNSTPRYKGPTVLKGVEVREMANGVVIRIKATGAKTDASFIRPDAGGTASLTLSKAKGNLSDMFRAFPKGQLKKIQAISFGSGAMQISITVNTDLYNVKSTDYHWDPKTNSYVVSIMSDVDVQAVHRAEKEQRIKQELDRDLQKWQFDTIVLDAGHGGKDPGAIGPAKTQEKDIVLKIVKYLGALIKNKWPEMKLVYTRGDDRFIPLQERGKIANSNNGKLFVSVHCNAAPNRAARGAEVYILGPHKNDAALKVAMLENAVIKQEDDYKTKYKGFSDEHMIMSSLAQNAFTLQSKEAAKYVLEGIESKAKINGRGVRQAGFMVLWTPSMPSLLVEAGYLSNRDEELLLRRKDVQKDIAEGIFKGISQYKQSYEKRQVASRKAAQTKG